MAAKRYAQTRPVLSVRWSAAIALGLLLLAGCVSHPPAAPGAAPPAIRLIQASDTCARNCYEITVGVDGQGRVAVAPGFMPELLVSDDGYGPFAARPKPAPPVDPSTDGRDSLVQAGPDGRLYFSTLVTVPLPVSLPNEYDEGASTSTSSGIQVAATSDGGRTWDSNVEVTLADGNAMVVPDRQWLGFGENGTVYLSTYLVSVSGIYIARSDDAGRTFSPLVRASSQVGSYAGGPVVNGHQVAVPLAGGQVRLAMSHDDGRSFADVTVAPGDASSSSSDFFAVAAWGRAGLVVAWLDGNEQLVGVSHHDKVHVARSIDGGATWSPVLGFGHGANTSPWVGMWDDKTILAWIDSSGSDSELHVASLPEAAWAGAAVHPVAVTDFPGDANTDFVSGSVAPDGTLWIAYSSQGKPMVAAVPPGVLQ